MTQQPPPPTLQYATPMPNSAVRDVAIAQRRIMWVILGTILVTILSLSVGIGLPLGGNIGPILVALGFLAFRLAMLVVMIYCIYSLTAALGMSMSSRVLYCVGMIIPCVSLILLLVANQKATGLLQRNNVKVGLMGAKLSDLPVV